MAAWDRRTHSFFAFAVVVVASPWLQGAGCTSHYTARLQGEVALDPAQQAVAGHQVRVIYRNRGVDAVLCAANWDPCLRAPGWEPLRACQGTEPGAGSQPSAPVRAGASEVAFDACTKMIGVDYQADVAAYIDADGDGVLDEGETYGVFLANPITREQEPSLLPLSIRLDHRFGG